MTFAITFSPIIITILRGYIMPMTMELTDSHPEKVQYNSPDFPIYIRRALLSTYPNFSAGTHWHDDIELIFIIAGEMTYNVNGILTNLKSGEGIFVNSKQLHFGFSADKHECDFICVLLHPSLLCAVAETERRFVLPVIRNSDVPYVHLTSDVLWQKEILALIRKLYSDSDTVIAPLKTQATFFEIWSLLYENISLKSATAKAENLDLTIIKNMVRFLQQNYDKKISLSEIAISGSVGQSKCCKLFAQYFAMSPIQYLNQYRLNKSTCLLKETDLSITDIALSIGFNGGSYYAETFKRWLGKTPSEYRKHNR